jgi:exopolysaccharide production protein ExoZ
LLASCGHEPGRSKVIKCYAGRVKTLLSVQYLRAVAALMVVAYHSTRLNDFKFEVGAAGVDVFFVISGFILWTIASEKPVTPGKFLLRRWQRVAPLYWTMTLVVVAGCAIWPRLIYDAYPTWPHVLKSLAFIPHLNADGGPYPVITDGWTLCYEAIFYLMFAAALLAPKRWRLGLLSVFLILPTLYGYEINRPAYMLWANMFFLQFGAGVWLAEMRLRGKLPSRRAGIILAAMAMASYGLLLAFNPLVYFWRPIIWGVPAALLVAGLVSVESQGGLPEVRWLHFLGDASYAVYLAHFLYIELLAKVLWPGLPVFALLAFTGGLAVGVAVHLVLERPLLALARGQKLGFLPSKAI